MEKFRFSFLLLVLGLVCLSTNTLTAYELKVGDPFPTLMLPSLEDNRPLSIADFRGEKLILHIWASW
jgi:hypothetical protein